MSYGTPQQTSKSPGGLLFLIILAVAAFMIFGRGTGGTPDAKPRLPGDWNDNSQLPGSESIPDKPDWESPKRPDRGSSNDSDWESPPVEKSRMPSNTGGDADDSDWSIEEVDQKNSENQNPSNKQPRFEVSNENDSQAKPKSTRKGDWELEEVTNKDEK
jgi:hypothetical protein